MNSAFAEFHYTHKADEIDDPLILTQTTSGANFDFVHIFGRYNFFTIKYHHQIVCVNKAVLYCGIPCFQIYIILNQRNERKTDWEFL